METRWLYTTSEKFNDLRNASKDTCVIPMGCIEKHGLHLPLGQDIVQISHLAYMASQLETVCVFPDFTFGNLPLNSPYMPAGTVTLPVETMMKLLDELCEQISRNGFKKIIVYNGHGGNRYFLNTFQRKLENKKHDFVFIICEVVLTAPHKIAQKIISDGAQYFPELTAEDTELILKYHEEGYENGHGCLGETAYMMGISPENVKLDRLGIESGQSTHEADYLSEAGLNSMFSWGINFPNSYAGDDPIGCNERIGKAALRLEAERFAKAIKLIKEDEDLLKWHNQAWNTKI